MSKDVPVRRTKIAEDYAKKVRVEPPKETRQEDPRTKAIKKANETTRSTRGAR